MRRASLTVLLTCLVLTVGGCASERGTEKGKIQPAPGTAWMLLASDSRGAVISNGETTRGLRRDGTLAWEQAGPITGAACIEKCPAAITTPGPDHQPYVLHGSTTSPAWVSNIPRNLVRVLEASPDALLAITGGNRPALRTISSSPTAARADHARLARRLSQTDGLWFPAPDRQAGVYAAPAAQGGRVIHYLLTHTGDAWQIADRYESHTPVSCVSGDTSILVTPAAFSTARLPPELKTPNGFSNCAATPQAIVAAKTYLALDRLTGQERSIAELTTFTYNGVIRWAETFTDYLDFRISPDGATTAVICDDMVVQIDNETGDHVGAELGAAGAGFTQENELVVVDWDGAARWFETS